MQAGADQRTAYALAMAALSHSQRADFGQIFPADMQRADPLHPAVVIHNKVTELVIERANRATQQQPFAGKLLKQAVDRFDIAHVGWTDFAGSGTGGSVHDRHFQ